MYLVGYSLDNLSLMALTVAVGFVVDDAIVMLEEHIYRHVEEGMSPAGGGAQGRKRDRLPSYSRSRCLRWWPYCSSRCC